MSVMFEEVSAQLEDEEAGAVIRSEDDGQSDAHSGEVSLLTLRNLQGAARWREMRVFAD